MVLVAQFYFIRLIDLINLAKFPIWCQKTALQP